MQTRWFLSKFYQDETLKVPVPVCSAYGGEWHCATFPADISTDWALVVMFTSAHQIEAAKEDARVIVCPMLFDPSPLDDRITSAYAHWGAKPGMSMGALIAAISESEPLFGRLAN